MPDWEKLLKQLASVKEAPVPFVIAVLVVGGAIWLVLNWAYGSVVSSKDAQINTKDSQIELLKEEVANWKEKTNNATPDAAKAKLDDLEKRLARIEPRRLTEDQIKTISQKIPASGSQKYRLGIQSDMSCPDCTLYAADLERAFTSANWEITDSRVMAASAASPKGIAILTPDPRTPLPEAEALVRALTAANIPFDLKAGSDTHMSAFGIDHTAALLITFRSTP